MRINATGRCLMVALILSALLLIPAAGSFADETRETTAANLLKQGEDLLNAGKYTEALPVLERVMTEYYGTGPAAYAPLRHVTVLLLLRRYDEAVTEARSIIATNPVPLVVEYTRPVLGEALLKTGHFNEGIAELLTEAKLHPSYGFGPMTSARDILGRICTNGLGDNAETTAAQMLGLDVQGKAGEAEARAIVAAYRAQQGRPDLAIQGVEKMGVDFPSQTEEITWASGRVALAIAWDVKGYSDWAAKVMRTITTSPKYDADTQAKAKAWVANYDKAHANDSTATQ